MNNLRDLRAVNSERRGPVQYGCHETRDIIADVENEPDWK